MSALLLDTNVVSELLRPQPNATVLRWLAAQPARTHRISAVTQAEMLVGARLLPAGRRRQHLLDQLDAMFAEEFQGRIWPFDSAAAAAYAEVVAARRAVGRPISQFDAQIAAIALARGAGVATRNTVDFEHCGIEIRNPWLDA